MGTDFGLAYSPQLLDKCSNRSLEFKVSALEPCSLKAASTILGTITKNSVSEIAEIRTLELSVLFRAALRDTNIALSNEFARLCELLQQDYFETIILLRE